MNRGLVVISMDFFYWLIDANMACMFFYIYDLVFAMRGMIIDLSLENSLHINPPVSCGTILVILLDTNSVTLGTTYRDQLHSTFGFGCLSLCITGL